MVPPVSFVLETFKYWVYLIEGSLITKICKSTKFTENFTKSKKQFLLIPNKMNELKDLYVGF